MRMSLNTPIARLTVDLPEEKAMELIRKALDYATGKPVESPMEPVAPPPPPPPKVESIPATAPTPVPEEPERKVETKPISKLEYRGFIFAKCESCGKFRGFCAKNPISRHFCECGHKTPLKDMKVMFVDCECGKKFKYLTNATEQMITINCIECGTPIELEYHDKKQEYVTIK